MLDLAVRQRPPRLVICDDHVTDHHKLQLPFLPMTLDISQGNSVFPTKVSRVSSPKSG
jgi:hypothetical protein